MIQMYKDKFVCCVLVNGKPQKEKWGNTVEVPFGSEFKIRFRNKHNCRAVVKFSIDGEDASGGGYVIPANSFIDIERFSDTPKKFKFVALDSEASIDFGKNGGDDGLNGLIEVKFYLENSSSKEDVLDQIKELLDKQQRKDKPYVPYVPPYIPYWPYDPWDYPTTGTNPWLPKRNWVLSQNNHTDVLRAASFGSSVNNLGGEPIEACMNGTTPNINYLSTMHSSNLNPLSVDENDTSKQGVTVEGGYSNQGFYKANVDYDENSFVTLTLRLRSTKSTQEIHKEKNKDLQQVVESVAEQLKRTQKEQKIIQLEYQVEKIMKQLKELQEVS